MLGFQRSVPVTLAGWLWADILLGIFVIFLAANSVSAVVTPPQPATAREGIDPKPIELTVEIDGTTLLGSDKTATEREQSRIATEVERRLSLAGEQRRVALVLAYGTHQDPAAGDRLAGAATGGFARATRFADAAVRTYHALLRDDRGTKLVLEIFLFQ